MLEKFRFGLVVVAIAALGLFAIACSEEEVEEATNTTSATGAAAKAKDGVTPAKAQAAMEKPAEKKAEPKLVETSKTSKKLLQQTTKLLD